MAYTLTIQPEPAAPLNAPIDVTIVIEGDAAYYVKVGYAGLDQWPETNVSNAVVRIGHTCQLIVQVLDTARTVLETRQLDYVVQTVQPVLDIPNYSNVTEFLSASNFVFHSTRPGTVTYRLLRLSGTEFFVSPPLSVDTPVGTGYDSATVTVSASCILEATFISDQSITVVETFRFCKISELSAIKILSSSDMTDLFVHENTLGWILKDGSLQAGYLSELGALTGKYPPRTSMCNLALGTCCVEGIVRFRAALYSMEAAPNSCLTISVNGTMQASYYATGGHWFEARVPAGPLHVAFFYTSGWTAAINDDYVRIEAIELPRRVQYTALPQLRMTDSIRLADTLIARYFVDNTAETVLFTEDDAIPVELSKNSLNCFGSNLIIESSSKAVRVQVLDAQDALLESASAKYTVSNNSEIASTAYYPDSTLEAWSKGLTQFRWHSSAALTSESSWHVVGELLRSPGIGFGTSVLWAAVMQGISGTLQVTYNVVFDEAKGPSNDKAWLQHSSSDYLCELDLSTTGQKIVTASRDAITAMLKLVYCRSPYSRPDQYVEIISINLPLIPRIGFTGYTYPVTENWADGFDSMPWTVIGDWQLPLPGSGITLSKGSIGDSQTSYIEFALDCIDGTLQVLWGISSEDGYDYGTLYIDGAAITDMSGMVDFHVYSVAVVAGLHTFRFEYSKDSSVADGLDTLFIKRIDFPVAGAVPFMDTFDQYEYVLGGSVATAWTVGPAPSLSASGASIELITGQTATLEITRQLIAGPLNVYWSITHTGTEYPRPTTLELYFNDTLYASLTEGNAYTTLNPSTGLHKLTIKAIGVYATPSTIRIVKVDFPVAAETLLAATPPQGKVTFPCTVSLTTPIVGADIRYTLDGTEPTESNGTIYTTGVELVGPALLKAVLLNPDVQGSASFTYFEALALTDPYQTVSLLPNRLTKRYDLGEPIALPTYPENLPVYYTSSLDDHTVQRLYSDMPLSLVGAQNIRAYLPRLLPTEIGRFLSNQQPIIDAAYDLPIYLTYGPIPDESEDESEEYTRAVLQFIACDRIITSYRPTILPSIPPGTYRFSVPLVLRCSLPEAEILYTLDGSDPLGGLTYAGEILQIEEGTVVRCSASLNSLTELFSFSYEIDPNLSDVQIIALSKTISTSSKSMSQSCKTVSVDKTFSYGTVRACTNMSELTDALEQTSYVRYCEYVNENNIPALFADAAMTQPFPFAFSVVVSLGSTISVPDENSVIYRDQERVTGFTQDGLACQFDDPIGSNTSVRIVSDFCLRLCLDVEQDSPEDCILQVWTNIPAGTYLMSSSSAVLLSNDGIQFSRHIQLQRTDLYLKGHMAEPLYGNNLFDVNINLYSSEVYNVS